MRELFVKADPILYESRSRSVRIHGVLTSLRLENMMWETLAQIALEDSRTTNSLLVQLHDEVMAHRGEVNNFASFLRVTCLRYLRHKYESSLSNLPKPAADSPVVKMVGRA